VMRVSDEVMTSLEHSMQNTCLLSFLRLRGRLGAAPDPLIETNKTYFTSRIRTASDERDMIQHLFNTLVTHILDEAMHCAQKDTPTRRTILLPDLQHAFEATKTHLSVVASTR
jgi:histone H3/H4